MDKRTKEKATALILTLLCVLLSISFPAYKEMGIGIGATLGQRAGYHFFHANIFHALCNSWCLLTLVFFYPVRMWQLIAAYIIAVTFPIDTIYYMIGEDNVMPTLGLSGVCFALTGIVTFETKKPLTYLVSVIALIFLGTLFAYMNALLHFYCYIAGLAIAFLNTPMNRLFPDKR